MSRESERIRDLYRQLRRAKLLAFSKSREALDVPDKHGVYIIFSPSRVVLHVGRKIRGKRGLRQRLSNHLHGALSEISAQNISALAKMLPNTSLERAREG
jgi:excinuclease UvrABC nuclease subunit